MTETKKMRLNTFNCLNFFYLTKKSFLTKKSTKKFHFTENFVFRYTPNKSKDLYVVRVKRVKNERDLKKRESL